MEFKINNLRISDLSELGLPLLLARPVEFNLAPVVAEGTIRAVITSRELADEFAEVSGGQPSDFPMSTRIFDFSVQESDDVIVRSADGDLPLVIRRDGQVIVNFDIRATQVFHFADSPRPIYTYIPGFSIHSVPERIRRPISNLVYSLSAPRSLDVAGSYKRLPLTGFEFALFLLNSILTSGLPECPQTFRWPHGKRAVFIALHDVDTAGFLRRGERDPLFRIEVEHQIRSTWFIPTKILNGSGHATDFLLESGNDVGWHGHKHDHRDHIKPFADEAVRALQESRLGDTAKCPVGMRLPKLLKSNYLFERLDHHCPTLCYDTSFFGGIVPYQLWFKGRESRILEIPTTVPTEIRVFNELQGLPRARKADAILKVQIARTQKLLEAGAVISIVTHPEKELSERPEFLDIYNQYLSYVRSCPDIWLATAGELFQYWTQKSFHLAGPTV
jgi:peptidoglycan/xylan/chitin deacetylase (PgdA/CDA1 family)